MTQEQKRIKLAEAAGWRQSTVTKKWVHKSNEADKHFNSAWVSESELPDYFNDLNAVHELEKVLNDIKSAEYARILTSIAWQSEQPTFAPMTATAAQRCKALGLTLGLWEATK